MSRRTPAPATEWDDRIRAAEFAAYRHYGVEPAELNVRLPGVAGAGSVRVTVFGEPDAEPPVVLLHGIASATILAAPLLPHLAGRRVYAVDWPGHGLSEPAVLPPTMPFRTYASSVMRALLDQLGLTEVDLVGHSLGAQISLYSALDLGQTVRRIALLGAPGASIDGARPLPVMMLLALPRLGEALLSLPMSDRMFERNNEQALGAGALDQVPLELVEALRLIGGRTSNAQSIASFFRGLIKRASLRAGVPLTPAELGRVTQPTLMAWGDSDVFLTPSQAASSIVALRDLRLVRVPGAGHAPWLHAPEIVGRAVASHLGIEPVKDPPLRRLMRSQS